MQSLSPAKYRTAGPRLSNSQKGSVPPIYTKGDTLYSADVVAGAPRERSCARRETLERMELSRCARGRVPSPPMLAPARSRSAAAWRSLRGAVGPKGCWLSVCGRRRVVAVCGWWGSLGSAPRGVLVESIQGYFQKSQDIRCREGCFRGEL